MTAEGRSLNHTRMTLFLGDVSLIKLGVSEEEYVHLSSEVRMFLFLPYIFTTDVNLFSAIGDYSKKRCNKQLDYERSLSPRRSNKLLIMSSRFLWRDALSSTITHRNREQIM